MRGTVETVEQTGRSRERRAARADFCIVEISRVPASGVGCKLAPASVPATPSTGERFCESSQVKALSAPLPGLLPELGGRSPTLLSSFPVSTNGGDGAEDSVKVSTPEAVKVVKAEPMACSSFTSTSGAPSVKDGTGGPVSQP